MYAIHFDPNYIRKINIILILMFHFSFPHPNVNGSLDSQVYCKFPKNSAL